MPTFPFYKQHDTMDCGPSCLRMISKYYGRHFSLDNLRQKSGFSKEGVSLLGISEAAENIGYHTAGVKLNFEQLIKATKLPCIVHWGQDHFVVVTPSSTLKKIIIADPATGIIECSKESFLKKWSSNKNNSEQTGIALLLEPTAAFYKQEGDKDKKLGWSILLQQLTRHKKYIVQVFMGLGIGSLLQLVLPFLTQSIVDTGINTHNLQFIYIVLIAQFMLFFGRTVVEFIRSRILLFISTRINLSLLSFFWIKLMRLPLSFFDTKMTGDILQRIGDHRKIESFLTGSTLNVLFSCINLVMFSIVLLMYDWRIFFIFCIGSIIYFSWIKLFLKYRRNLNYKTFDLSAKENGITMQMIQGMQDIKLNNAEHLRRWEWENVQASIFNLSFKNLSLSQYQQAGALFINEGKNMLITFFVAKAVLDGQLTLGAMMAIQSIIGQLNSPIEQLISFVQQAQDARISLERLNEIHQLEEEEPAEKTFITHLPQDRSIHINDLSFTYAGAGNEPVLKNLDLVIPEGKVTAIVGMSGSGKTTLLKLLLQFYSGYKGSLKIGDSSLQHISPKYWRHNCGTVMQDGFIFSDTIAKNIAVSDEVTDHKKLLHACKVANILSFIESLPLGFQTKIGAEGNGISAGQRQRILIARAVYKNPEYLFFDEATNALDANNEKLIMEQLQEFFKGKTVVVVAHRLSTVKNADKIVVLDKGEIIEEGTHEQLARRKKNYFELVRNQLEMGN
ncbi:peptidase domain-containing ABC transporter [Ferruginibacter sp.]